MKKFILAAIICLAGMNVPAAETDAAGGAVRTLTLKESIETALDNSPQIKIAEQKLKDAKGQEISAFAGFIPSLSLTGSQLTVKEEQVLPLPFGPGGTTIDMVLMAKNTYSYGYSIQQNLFTAGKVINGYGISRANMRAAREEYRKTRNEVIFETTKGFYSLLLAQEMTSLLEESYKQMEEHVSQVKAYYDNGIISKLDLLRAQVQLLNLKPQVTRARNGVKLAEDYFNMTLGISVQTHFKLEGEFRFEEIRVNQEELIKTALENKPELKMLEERVSMARKAYALAIESNGPNLIGIYSSKRTNPYNLMEGWGDDWNIVLSLQWPLGLGGYGRAKSAKAQYEQAEYGLQLLKDGAVIEVKQLCMTLQQEKENIESQTENIAQAEEALKIAEERYKSGIISNLEYMDTQIAQTQAKTNYFQAIANYAIAKAQLLKATGK